MIQPGLERVARLLGAFNQRWWAVHIAGTNGKGTTSVYISGMLETYNDSNYRKRTGAAPLRTGRFTSPHLIKPSDSIQLPKQVFDKELLRVRDYRHDNPQPSFQERKKSLWQTNIRFGIGASEFEILTAIAFHMFQHEGVHVGVVEAGMGGRLDATNVIGQPLVDVHGAPRPREMDRRGQVRLVSVLTKIGLDHQDFLGSTLSAVAEEKAGIIHQGVPVVSDSSQDTAAQAVISQKARGMSAQEVQLSSILPLIQLTELDRFKRTLPISELQACIIDRLYQGSASPDVEKAVASMLARSGTDASLDEVPKHVKQNTSVAFRAAWTSLYRMGRIPMLGMPDVEGGKLPLDYPSAQEDLTSLAYDMLSVPQKTVFPGRQQRLILRTSADTEQEALLDGAHNAQSAEVLAIAVEKLRAKDMVTNPERKGAATYVIAASNSKDVTTILKPLLKPGDSVFAVRFGAVEDMPWVKAMAPEAILQAASAVVEDPNSLYLRSCDSDMVGALAEACQKADGGVMVVAGSLYLAGKVLELCGETSGL